MLSTAEVRETRSTSGSTSLLFLVPDRSLDCEWLSTLASEGYRIKQVRDAREAEAALRGERTSLLVLAYDGSVGSTFASLRRAARDRDVPILDVVDKVPSPLALAAHHVEADDWVLRGQAEVEISARIARLIARSEAKRSAARSTAGSPLASTQFFSLVVHDLRTPLNVIGLSLRMIGQAIPKGDPELDEDLRFIDENFKQIERMLAQLSDYCRLFEAGMRVSITELSPRRLVTDLLETRPVRVGARGAPIRLEVDPSCPEEVSLDPSRAHSAIQYALANALAAAGDGSVSVALRGTGDRWVTEISVDRAAPASVKAFEMRPGSFERLCGTAAERRGMDLAIAARISELFGGTVRLDVGERSTMIVLDWPARFVVAEA